MSFVFDTSHIDVIEEWLRISPPAAITLPVGDPLARQHVVYICQPPGTGEREDQTELLYLARLIAAAPDLLRLARATSHVGKSLRAVREGISDELILELVQLADRTIAEAEGAIQSANAGKPQPTSDRPEERQKQNNNPGESL
ncbi:MAG TPA: hypothetical protein VKX49_12405 [Bryobacteraceae bacterium]|nr:hypothetical protein [Bryobacteraceae bacterium]